MATRTTALQKQKDGTTPTPTPGAQVLVGGLCFNQCGGFICSIVPDEDLRWHPDEHAVYVDVAGNERRLTMKRTAKAKTIRAGSESLVQGDFDSDEEGPDWMVLRLTNLGHPVEIWHAWVIEEWERKTKKKWRPGR